MSDARVHHILFVSYGTHQSCSLYAEAPNVWIFHFHTVFIMKRLLKCRQILIWKAAASSRHTHAHRHRPTKNSCVAEEGRDRQHHSPTTRQAHAHSVTVTKNSCVAEEGRDRLHHSPTTRQAHAHSVTVTKNSRVAEEGRDRLHHSPTTRRLLGGYEAGSVFTTSAATKSSVFSMSSFSSATPSHQHSANTNKQPQVVNTVQALTNNPKPSTQCKH